MKVVAVLDGTPTAAQIAEGLAKQAELKPGLFDLKVIEVQRTGTKFLGADAEGAEIREYAGTPEQLIPHVGDADVLAVHIAPVSRSVIDAAPNLKLIACARGGPVNVNVDYAASRGIAVVYTPGRNADAVADITIGMMIVQARSMFRAANTLRHDPDLAWNREERKTYVGTELPGKTLGLVGFGAVGRKVVRRALGFDMRVLVYDPYIDPQSISETGAEPCDLDRLLAESDFVSLHMRLTEETESFVNAEFLAKMKPTAYLINTARGGVVDEQALYKALTSGAIAGAALDVMREEPPSAANPLLSLDNVTVLPHIGGQTREINARGAAMIVEDVVAFVEGRQPSRVFRR